MNTTQRRYALDRVNDIARTKLSALQPPSRDRLEGSELLSLLKAGKLKLKDNLSVLEVSQHSYLSRIFDIPVPDEESEAVKTKRESAMKAVKSEALGVSDQIMLGDAQEALKLLSEFEAS